MAKSVTLLIPGLLDHLPDPVPRLPALETLLARANCRHDLPVGYERTLMHLFGYQQSPDRDVPEGALGRYAQTGVKPEGTWLCAAPVHLIADQSQVYLHALDESALNESEAVQLITELNKVYSEDGWEFVQHTSTHWYLHIPEAPNITTTPLHAVDGKNIHDKLPQGDDALQWHRVLNEMQMLLHSSSVNQVRQEKGQVAVNGVWLWGLGELPANSELSQLNIVWTSEPLAQGLALLNQVALSELPDNVETLLQHTSDGEQLAVLKAITMSELDEMVKLDRDWIAPLITAVRNGEIKSIQINNRKLDSLSILGKIKNLFLFS